MMYPFLQLEDGTEIVHSERLPDDSVRVHVEKPDEKDCFHQAECYLPAYRWENVQGFTDEEIAKYRKILESVAHLILAFSSQGGFEHAAGF
ncbi:MAG: hypothetical protein IJK02_06420 [Clostridia bacterium]|nr:hypothetical protein [Clostridia bacterium]